MRIRALALIVALALSLCFAGAAVSSVGVVDWEYSFVNMRTAPSTGAKKILRIPEGTRVEVLEDKGEWLRIGHAGKQGWVVSRSVQLLKVSTVAASVEEQSAAAPERQQTPSAPSMPSAPQPPQPPVHMEDAAKPYGNSAKDTRLPTSGAAIAAIAAIAPGTDQRQQTPAVSLGTNLSSVFMVLLLVLALAGAIFWYLRRLLIERAPDLEENPAIKVLSTRPLGTRQALLLVEIGGEVYLLAQSEGGVDLLTRIDTPSALERLDELVDLSKETLEEVLKRQADPEGAADVAGQTPIGGEGDEQSVSPQERLDMLRRKPIKLKDQ